MRQPGDQLELPVDVSANRRETVIMPRTTPIVVQRHAGRSEPVEVKTTKLSLDPEHASRLTFYSTLATSAPQAASDRIRRNRPPEVLADPTDDASQKLTADFLKEASEKPALEPTVTVNDETLLEEQLFTIAMDDIMADEPRPIRAKPHISPWRSAISSLKHRIQPSTKRPVKAKPARRANLATTGRQLEFPMMRPANPSDLQRATSKTETKNTAKTMVGIMIIVISVVAGYHFIIPPIQQSRHLAAVSNQEWQIAKSQWQCTLQQYQVQQSYTSNNKETSCAN